MRQVFVVRVYQASKKLLRSAQANFPSQEHVVLVTALHDPTNAMEPPLSDHHVARSNGSYAMGWLAFITRKWAATYSTLYRLDLLVWCPIASGRTRYGIGRGGEVGSLLMYMHVCSATIWVVQTISHSAKSTPYFACHRSSEGEFRCDEMLLIWFRSVVLLSRCNMLWPRGFRRWLTSRWWQ